MPAGFFFESEELGRNEPITTVPQCGACGLYKKCESPKMAPSGRGKKRILVVGQSPGKQEDRQGEAFVGPSGQILKERLRKFGVDLKNDCIVTNALICHPPGDKIDDLKKIDYCRPNVIKTIEEHKPEIIILLGREALISVIGWLYKAEVRADSVTKWLGWQIPEQTLNAWICPTWHPSYVIREGYGQSGKPNKVLLMMWEYHLEQALKKKGRPWKTAPDYNAQIEKITNAREAAKMVRWMRKKGGLVTFDYETNQLKPDSKDAIIVSCSICWRGKITIAFPWAGEVIDEMSQLLKDPRVAKAGQNIKFEDRWTRAVLGHEVVNWKWCTMIGQHICDNRSGITGLKFQAFTRLGFGAYDEHIEPLLHSKKGAKVNQILEEITLDDLLQYNGLDSLLEYLIIKPQAEYLKCKSMFMQKN